MTVWRSATIADRSAIIAWLVLPDPFPHLPQSAQFAGSAGSAVVVVQCVQLHGLHGLHKGLNGKRQRSCAMCANHPLRGVALCTLCTTVACCLMARVFGLI